MRLKHNLSWLVILKSDEFLLSIYYCIKRNRLVSNWILHQYSDMEYIDYIFWGGNFELELLWYSVISEWGSCCASGGGIPDLRLEGWDRGGFLVVHWQVYQLRGLAAKHGNSSSCLSIKWEGLTDLWNNIVMDSWNGTSVLNDSNKIPA